MTAPLADVRISADTRVVLQRRELALHLAVPLESRDGPLPAALHLPQRRLVVGVARGDGFPEVLVLRLDDLVRVVAVVRHVARSTQLSARHALHLRPFLSVRIPQRY